MKKAAPPPPEEDKEEWMVTYADAITLLMAFFVMLLTFKEYDAGQREEAVAAIKENLGNQQNVERPMMNLMNGLNSILDGGQIQPEDATVSFDDSGVVIEFSSKSFFKSGSATLKPEATEILAGIAEELQEPMYQLYFLEVEGHTDDVPIKTRMFPSNWELSTARAAIVVREFIELDIKPARLKAAGYADTRPKEPNKDMFGEAIPENREINRRVAIRLHP